MSKFNIGDWVEITATPDYRWGRWSFNREYYDNFAGKFGIIQDIQPDIDDDGVILYKIGVDFEEEISDGYTLFDPGVYREWFKSDHIILSSKFESERKNSIIRAGKELQEWEEFKKKSVNKALKSVFCPEPPPKKLETEKEVLSKDNLTVPDPINYSSWLMDSRSNSIDPEDYDINLLDFLNPNNMYLDSDD